MTDDNIAPVTNVPGATPNPTGAAARPQAVGTPSRRVKAPESLKDNPREIVETVVFVVVLVLLLKSFVAEAFVIPTGSMAETLFGYQKLVQCDRCHYKFPVNASSEVEPARANDRAAVTHAVCPNCRHPMHLAPNNPAPRTGDRVLVAKFLYDLPFKSPQRQDVVVFKYPYTPQQDYVPLNYIKRLVGLPGETVAIHGGDLYVYEGLKHDDQAVPPTERWRHHWPDESEARAPDDSAHDPFFDGKAGEKSYPTHVNHPESLKLFWEGKYHLVRKGPDKILALRRIVYDNDHQDPALEPRWVADATWIPDAPKQARRFTYRGGNEELAWLRYRHLLRGANRPQLITDFLGYDSGSYVGHPGHPPENWVGDLILEGDFEVLKAEGQLVLELSRGVDRFQAQFDLATGVCTLVRLGEKGAESLGVGQPTKVKAPGTYRLRFANVDGRLVVWVNNGLPFGDGVVYPAPEKRGPRDNDLEPAGIAVKGGAVAVSALKLWRDTYYTYRAGSADADATHGQDERQVRPPGHRHEAWSGNWGNPADWEPLRQLPVKTIYVQPGHYLCMGDNSPESSDGRTWGLVPERLMLGRALAIYWPYYRIGRIE